MDVSEHCMYQMANSCTIALSEAGTALFEGGIQSKTCMYHVQTSMTMYIQCLNLYIQIHMKVCICICYVYSTNSCTIALFEARTAEYRRLQTVYRHGWTMMNWGEQCKEHSKWWTCLYHVQTSTVTSPWKTTGRGSRERCGFQEAVVSQELHVSKR